MTPEQEKIKKHVLHGIITIDEAIDICKVREYDLPFTEEEVGQIRKAEAERTQE